MRLSELMAAVRMTPIKEREEEEGLGEAEVAVDCYGGDGSARKRTVEQQEEEIRQWEAMLAAEDEDKRQQSETVPQTAVGSEADCFHTASELEFELTELQQLSVADDDRRSSLFVTIPLPPPSEWMASDGDAPPTEEGAAIDALLPAADAFSEGITAAVDDTEIELQRPRTVADIDTDARADDSEIELQKRNDAVPNDDLPTDAEAPSTALLPAGINADVQAELVVPAEQDQTSEEPSVTAAHSGVQVELELENGVEVDSVAAEEEQQQTAPDDDGEKDSDFAEVAEVEHISEHGVSSDGASWVKVNEWAEERSMTESSSSLSLLEKCLPPSSLPSCSALPSPCPSCTSCSALFASLQHYQTSCEKQSSQLQQLVDEQAETARETAAKLQKEDDDYKTLYFAYCQLERDYNALKAAQHTQPADEDVDEDEEADDGDEAEQNVEATALDAAVDYAAMSEEKVVPCKTPPVTLLDQLTAELQQLKLDKAAGEAQVETKMAAAETEAVELSNKYEQLRVDYSLQSEQLTEALRAVEDLKLAQAQLSETHELQMQEKEQQIERANECILSLEANKQQLITDLQASQHQLDQLHTQLQALTTSHQHLTTTLTTQQLETQQLQALLSEQRDTTDYVHNEKLALEQELSNLHTAHTATVAHYEQLLSHHQQKDADLLSVIDDSIANIEQLRSQLANYRLAFRRCHHTLLERVDEGVVREEELWAVRLELQQTAAELGVEAERVVGMAAQLTEADGMRAALESRLRCSEDRVEELTALMATVEHDKQKHKHIHTTLTTQLTEANLLIDEHKSKTRDLTKQLRLADDRSLRLEGDVTSHQQKHVRLQSELQRERDERRRETERRRDVEAALERLQQHAAALEGQQEALTESIQLRPLGVATDEYERRLRDKEALILRLGKTVKQMHRHIEVDVAQRESELGRTIRQMQRLFVVVVKILGKPEYSGDNDVRRLLEVLEREGAAIDAKGKEEVKDKAGH